MRVVTSLSAGLAAVSLAVISLAAAPTTAQALTIAPTFDASITSRSDAADIEASINAASAFYKAFSDPVTVNITFKVGDTPGFLARSLTSLYGFEYPDYVFGLSLQAALHPENAVLQSAVANLGYGNAADVVILTSANLNTLVVPFGITFPGFVDGQMDGEVTLSGAPDKFAFAGPVGVGQYDPVSTLQHEIDEILGIGGDYLDFLPPGYVSAIDLDRYNGFHSPSLTQDPDEHSYFSYDGGQTVVRHYNQQAGGDYSDWAKTGCAHRSHVQDVFGCPDVGHFGLTRNSPEVLALQAIGYNLAAAPEPSTWALSILGLTTTGLALRTARRRRTA